MNTEQLLAIIWLRWRLTRNQFARGSALNIIVASLVIALLVLGAGGALVGGALLGYFGMAKAPPLGLLGAWDGVVFAFLIFWLTGLLIEIQRSETIDLAKLLHLPISLRQIFVVNYFASHLTPSVVLFVPFVLGFSAGLAAKLGGLMGLMLPLAFAFLFMVTAWTYCLRGWLAALMINKRRRRAVVAWLTIIAVGVSQLPNLLINSKIFHRQVRPMQTQGHGRQQQAATSDRNDTIATIHLVVPAGWVGYGAMTLRQGNVWPTLSTGLLAVAIGSLGLIRAYRMTMKFYTAAGASEGGAKPRKSAAASKSDERKNSGTRMVERSLPWFPDDVSALAFATLRGLLRAPEMKMALIMPVVFGAMIISMQFAKPGKSLSNVVSNFGAIIAVGVAMFSFVNLMGNMFGLDRNGFRALVLLPTSREKILTAKNLALFPFVGITALCLLLVAHILNPMPLTSLLAGIIQIFIAFTMFSLMCNLLSIYAPYKISSSSLQAKKPKGIVFIAAFGSMLLTPLVILPAVLPPLLQFALSLGGWVPWLPANLIASFGMLALALWLYSLMIPVQGRLLERNEQKILKEVTEDIE